MWRPSVRRHLIPVSHRVSAQRWFQWLELDRELLRQAIEAASGGRA
jgi:hypothetical protein